MTAAVWRQGGFSLIELLVASALGSLVVLTAGELLVVSRGIDRSDRGESRQLDAAHLALTLMARSVRQAGHGGCHPARRRSLIRAGDPGLEPTVSLRDGLTLRSMRSIGTARVGSAPTRAARLPLDRSHNVPPGGTVTVVNRHGTGCVRFRQGSDEPSVLDRGPGPGGINRQPREGYAPVGESVELLVPGRTRYYVDTSVDGDRRSLFRRRPANNGRREELVVGVQSLKAEAGVDRDGDGGVDDWLTAGIGPTGARVVAVRIRLQAESVDLASTVAVRNDRP